MITCTPTPSPTPTPTPTPQPSPQEGSVEFRNEKYSTENEDGEKRFKRLYGLGIL